MDEHRSGSGRNRRLQRGRYATTEVSSGASSPEAVSPERRRGPRRCGGLQARDEAGAALIVAITLTVFALGIVMSGSTLLRANRARIDTEFLVHGQAAGFARSGLNEALNWLRRQPAQPVTVFEPRLDLTAHPPVTDTLEPDIGLVREFRITGNIWGRYEVWKAWPADPVPERLAWREQAQVRDVAAERGSNVAGGVWALSCVGYVYRRNDANLPFDERPNDVLAREYFTTEATRLTIALPGIAALCCRTGGGVVIDVGGRVRGGASAAGLFHAASTGEPTIAGEASGSPGCAPAVGTYEDDAITVFGVSEPRLRTMADDHIVDPAAVPSPVPDDCFLFLEAPEFRFDAARPLSGTGILYVKGDVVIEAGSSSFFTGMLYVDGDLTIDGPAEIHGAVVVTGAATLAATGDFATIDYSALALTELQTRLNTYRFSRPVVRGGASF